MADAGSTEVILLTDGSVGWCFSDSTMATVAQYGRG